MYGGRAKWEAEQNRRAWNRRKETARQERMRSGWGVDSPIVLLFFLGLPLLLVTLPLYGAVYAFVRWALLPFGGSRRTEYWGYFPSTGMGRFNPPREQMDRFDREAKLRRNRVTKFQHSVLRWMAGRADLCLLPLPMLFAAIRSQPVTE